MFKKSTNEIESESHARVTTEMSFGVTNFVTFWYQLKIFFKKLFCFSFNKQGLSLKAVSFLK